MSVTFSQLIAVLFCATGLITCTKKAIHSQATSSESIFGSSECQANQESWTEFLAEKSTTLYHWTNVPLAAEDPWVFLKTVIASSKEMNKKGNYGTLFAGNGLYLGMDPFQSASYGKILVQFSVRAGSRFAGNVGPHSYPTENATRDCPGAVFSFSSSLRAPKQSEDENDPSGFALALYDLAPVERDSVQSFQTPLLPQAKLPEEAQNSGLSRLLTTPGFNAVIDGQIAIMNRLLGRSTTEEQSMKTAFKRDLALQCMGKNDLLNFPKEFTLGLEDKEIVEAFPMGPNPESVRTNVDARLRQVLSDALEIASDSQFLTPGYFCSSLTDDPFKRYNPLVLEEFLKRCGEVFEIPESQRVASSCEKAAGSLRKWDPSQDEVTKFERELKEYWTPVIDYWQKRYTLADWKILNVKDSGND